MRLAHFLTANCEMAFCCLACCFVAGCENPTTTGADREESEAAAVTTENDARFHPRLLEIAAEYQTYGLVNPAANVAPAACAAAPDPSVPASLSHSEDEDSHGKKLYYLFCKELDAYVGEDAHAAAAPGQVLVKESWAARKVADDESEPFEPRRHSSGNQVRAIASDPTREHIYTTGQQRELFVMYRLDADEPGTDNGWVYGTLTADGKKVTSAGVVESCAACHREAGPTRLLGVEAQRKPKLEP